MRIAIALFALVAGFSNTAFADEVDDFVDGMLLDDDMCSDVVNIQQQLQPKLPIKEADGHSTYGVVADCQNISLIFERAYPYTEAHLKRGWYATESKAWNKSVCSDKAMANAVKHDWHFRETLKFQNGKIYTIEAKC